MTSQNNISPFDTALVVGAAISTVLIGECKIGNSKTLRSDFLGFDLPAVKLQESGAEARPTPRPPTFPVQID